MRISIGQIIILFLLIFLLFGDFQEAKKKIKTTLKKINGFLKEKNRKKGT